MALAGLHKIQQSYRQLRDNMFSQQVPSLQPSQRIIISPYAATSNFCSHLSCYMVKCQPAFLAKYCIFPSGSFYFTVFDASEPPLLSDFVLLYILEPQYDWLYYQQFLHKSPWYLGCNVISVLAMLCCIIDHRDISRYL